MDKSDHTTQLTELICSEIKKQYKSDRKFAQTLNIPPTTLSSILKNGVRGTAFETVINICSVLGIRLVYSDSLQYADHYSFELLNDFAKLDDDGKKVVIVTIQSELKRLEYEKKREKYIKSYNSTTSNKYKAAQEKIAEIRNGIKYEKKD